MKQARNTQQEIADIRVGMQKHSDEDVQNFGKLTELLTQNGEHFSYFSKYLGEIKTEMSNHFEDEKQYRLQSTEWRQGIENDIKEIKKNVEPVLQEYKEGQETKRVWVRFSERVSTPVKKVAIGAGLLAGLSTSLIYLWHLFNNALHK